MLYDSDKPDNIINVDDDLALLFLLAELAVRQVATTPATVQKLQLPHRTSVGRLGLTEDHKIHFRCLSAN